ncbi:PTS sugar transporter subunit IIA [bacterium]|nr:PTS sugar transporter subunit IIA [bacterium]MBR6244800.1 PTS sugar transporter subunit IIA [bacterium]
MCRVSDYLKENLVFCNVELKSKEELFAFLAKNAGAAGDVPEEKILEHLKGRESYGSTGIGRGVAIPHCRISGSNEVLIQLVSLSEPIDYGSPDGEKVRLVFMLIVPEGNNQLYLRLISKISVVCANRIKRAALFSAKNAAELMNLVQKI